MRWQSILLSRLLYEAPEGDGGGGGGTGGAAGGVPGADAPKFNQAQVDAIINARFAEISRKHAAELEPLKTQAEKAAELEAKIEALESKGRSAAENARIAAERAANALTEGKAAAEKVAAEKLAEAEAWRTKYRTKTLDDAFAATLDYVELAARRDVVIATMKADIEVDRDDKDDDGKITAVRFGGLAKKDLLEAARAWFAANTWAVKSSGGGSGEHRQGRGAGGNSDGKRPSEMTRDELARRASAAAQR